MKELKCPVCKEPYSRWNLIYPRWYETCPNCKSKLALTTRTELLSAMIMGLIFVVAIIIFGKEKIFSMPFFIYFTALLLLSGKTSLILFAEFEKLSDKPGLLPIPRSSKYALLFILLGVILFIFIFVLVAAISVYW